MSADLQERLKQIIDAVAVQWDMSPFGERPRADLLQRLMHVFKYEQSQHYNEMKDLQRKIYALQSDLAEREREIEELRDRVRVAEDVHFL